LSGPFYYDTVSRNRRGVPVSSDREGPSLSAEEEAEADHRPSPQMATLSDKIKFEVNTAQNQWEITYHSLFRLPCFPASFAVFSSCFFFFWALSSTDLSSRRRFRMVV
jgi:hypothetical protein